MCHSEWSEESCCHSERSEESKNNILLLRRCALKLPRYFSHPAGKVTKRASRLTTKKFRFSEFASWAEFLEQKISAFCWSLHIINGYETRSLTWSLVCGWSVLDEWTTILIMKFFEFYEQTPPAFSHLLPPCGINLVRFTMLCMGSKIFPPW